VTFKEQPGPPEQLHDGLAAKFQAKKANFDVVMQNANALPITPLYAAVSKAVQDNAFAAITGSRPVETALSDMTKAIDSARAQ